MALFSGSGDVYVMGVVRGGEGSLLIYVPGSGFANVGIER